MTRTSVRHPRPSKKTMTHRYRPKVINIQELREKQPEEVPPRVIYVMSPFYEQMECGEKTVEARPNYPCLRDVKPGTLVEFSNRFSGTSFLAKITSRRVYRNFQTMLRQETIQACLPDHDPTDLQRAVNTYHSFRNETYKWIARKHGVVSFRFTLCSTENNISNEDTSEVLGQVDKKSLCSIFEHVKRARFIRKYGRSPDYLL